MILREILLQSSLIAGTCFLISIPISSGMLLRFISTLNNAPLHAALASNDATPTSETAFLFPSVINGEVLSKVQGLSMQCQMGFELLVVLLA